MSTEAQTPRRRGRPRIHADAAARKHAWRNRQRQPVSVPAPADAREQRAREAWFSLTEAERQHIRRALGCS